ncbi:MAG: NAD-dependent epimerase/dehydratase family protein [Pirellulales bacterium]|nr:NAD-dependent epimerase/dehydratase family protein [Pirellulales bacterium]
MSSGTVLITGATGLVGNNVARQLVDGGRQVRVLVRQGFDQRAFDGLNVEVAHGDITDAASVEQACDGVSAVVHSAGYVQIGRTNLDLHRAINVDGTRHVADAALARGIRMIHVSSCDTIHVAAPDKPADESSPHRDGINVPYVISKREAEIEIRERVDNGLDAVIVNPGFMLGPWDWKPSSGVMLLEVARGRGTFAPRGSFSVCDVRDVASAIVAALNPQVTGRQYLLTGETMRYIDAWRMFAEVTGGRKPLCRAGPLMLKIGGWGGDVWGRLSGKEPSMNSGALALAAQPKNYSSALAQRELGYQVRPFRESVEAAWEWFKEYGYA